MKILQMRKVLERASTILGHGGRKEEAEAVSRLAQALAVADRETVSQTVEKLDARR